MPTIFDHDVRILACEGCGGPLEAALAGGVFPCRSCGAANHITARDEALAPAAPLPEAERISRLRQQDGRPLLPPPGIASLVGPGGGIAPWKVQEAQAMWQGARRELRASPSSYEAAERLLFLTMLLSQHLQDQRDEVRQRALLESAAEAVTLPRHRNMLRGFLSRSACRAGDLRAAEAWLALCDPRSDDLQSDSSFRFSRALLETARGRPGAVLDALGQGLRDVPILDAMDAACVVLRANAWERLGQLPRAVEQLREYMAAAGAGGRAAVAKVRDTYPAWQLCAQSFPAAQAAHGAAAGERAASSVSGGIHSVFLFFGLLFLAFDAVAVVLIILGLTAGVISKTAVSALGTSLFTLVPMGVIFTLVGAVFRKKALRARWMREHGLPGSAEIVGATPTGMRINKIPMMRFQLVVRLQGRDPYQAEATALMDGALAPGATVAVRVDPQNLNDVQLELD